MQITFPYDSSVNVPSLCETKCELQGGASQSIPCGGVLSLLPPHVFPPLREERRSARGRTYPLIAFLKEGGTGILFRDPLFPFLQERVPAARQAG